MLGSDAGMVDMGDKQTRVSAADVHVRCYGTTNSRVLGWDRDETDRGLVVEMRNTAQRCGAAVGSVLAAWAQIHLCDKQERSGMLDAQGSHAATAGTTRGVETDALERQEDCAMLERLEMESILVERDAD